MEFGFAFPIRYVHVWLGLTTLVLALLVLALLATERRRRERVERFVEANLRDRLTAGRSVVSRRPLFWFTVVGSFFLALTFAQPRWGRAWQEVDRLSRDIMICLDTSESMLAKNPLPNRLERSKQKILALIDRAPGDRYGLVAFSGGAELQCPLTHDQGYFRAVLNAVDTDTISYEGTDIAAALHEATEVFKEDAEQTGDYNKDARAILLISDGEQVAGDAVEAAEEAARYARVYVIGVGDPNGAEIRIPDLVRRTTRGGGEATHLSKLDEDTLIKVAQFGQGGYIRTTPDNRDIEEIHGHIERLAARSADSDIRFHLVNRYQWPLALAILCFAAEGLWVAVLPKFRYWGRRFRSPREGVRGHA